MISSCMVRIHRYAVFCAVIVVLGGSLNIPTLQASSNPGYKPIIEQRIQRIQERILQAVLVKGETGQISNLADRMAELRVPGVSIAVIHDGKIDWARGFGEAETGGLPVTPETLFQAASISKPVTAMAVLHLVESGKLDLDSDASRYLKSWKIPDNEFVEQSEVTIGRLLSHTAGMTVHGFAGYASGDPLPSLIDVLNGEAPANSLPIVVDTMPGKIMRYSGGGYVVIQQLLEDVSGQPFPKLMRDTVLGPIGMSHSTFEQPLSQERLLEAATPYSSNGEAITGGPHVYPEMSAAGLWTTPSDLARFAIELQESMSGTPKRVLSAKMARKMITPVLNNYGLGLAVGGSTEKKYFAHGGANAGFQCNLVVYNDGDGAVIMTNSDTGAQLADEILRTIAYEYGWPDFQPAEQKEIKIAPESLEQFVGTYQLSPGFNMTITLEEGQLFTQISGQPKFPLFPESENKFFLKIVDSQHEYIKDDKGVVTHVIIRQGPAEIKAPRKP